MGKMWASIRGAFSWIGRQLWRWEVVAIGAPLIYGAGIGALYGDDYIVAETLFFAGIAWITAKVLSWEETRIHPNRQGISTLILLLGIGVFTASSFWISHRIEELAGRAKEGHPVVPNPPPPNETEKPQPPPPSSTQELKQLPAAPNRPKMRLKPNVSPTPQEPAKPTQPETPVMLTAEFISPASPALSVYNPSADVEEGVLWEMVAFRTSDLCFFGFQTQRIDFIKPQSRSANMAMELATMPKNAEGCDGAIREGDELTGSVSIDCPRCSIQTYIVHLVWKESGWYFESDTKGGYIVPKDMSKEGRQKYVQFMTSEQFASRRIEIKPQP